MTIDIDTAVRTMRSANPVPDPVSLATAMADSAVFLDVTKEATQMDTYQDTSKNTEEARSPGGGLRIAVAAFVVVLFVGAAAVFLLQANDEPSAAAPEDVALAFREAQNSGDSAAALALLAPGATFDGGMSANASEFVSQVDWYTALEWDFTPTECTEITTGSATTVTCSYTHENAWTRALGVGPFTGGEATYVVESGLITSYVWRFDNAGFSRQAWEPFTSWVILNHPDDRLTILTNGGTAPVLTPEALVLWAQFTQEFVAEKSG